MEPIDVRAIEESAYSWIEVDPKTCNKCGTCVFMCPRQAIPMNDLPYLIR